MLCSVILLGKRYNVSKLCCHTAFGSDKQASGHNAHAFLFYSTYMKYAA